MRKVLVATLLLFVAATVALVTYMFLPKGPVVAPEPVSLFVTLTDTRPETHQRTGVSGLPWNTLRSAVSQNGYDFVMDPQQWVRSDDMADPAVTVDADGTWVVASGTGSSSLRAASAQGCPTVTTFPEVTRGGGIPDVMPVEGGFRMYYSGDGGVLSAFSDDGNDWKQEKGIRLSTPEWLSLVADPAVTQRADGSYVMYFKGTEGIAKTPYEHTTYRATSVDGLRFTAEQQALIPHSSVPGAYTDSTGRVWLYYLNFAAWPEERESVWATYEREDGSLAEAKRVTFSPELPDYLWVNDPDPLVVPSSIDLAACDGVQAD